MEIKKRTEPAELVLHRILAARVKMPEREMIYYLNLEKGYEGEIAFDQWFTPYSQRLLILNDLLLETNHTIFQIDSMALSQNVLFNFEIKNYEGDYYLESDRWYTAANAEIKNPLLQLRKNEYLLRKLLQELGIKTHIESYLIFINPEFHLYNAPQSLPIVFPAQLNRFGEKIQRKAADVNKQQIELAERIASQHIVDSPYSRLPKFHYDDLQKGILCENCRSDNNYLVENMIVCKKCSLKENSNEAILRSIFEYRMLFPKKAITTNAIHEWCGGITSKKIIRKVLRKHFLLIGHARKAQYISRKNIVEN
ncbi:nuclease-related domain-containing protein [Falsibacillus albus]|uniref:NERD domain-containing protein n=1 Tax=Falsibacillus albus TaxID=2478915 RepID=A0A3L7K4T3_9BACI|nr:nuclease-related domain-containing protein [Falsibacillus albus]RLQ98096.1 NERD domain-containing protein [Falsibacillus albus]